ncbi:hypothetical protein FUSPEROL_00020 [Fusobacterium periodonticum ATCC 33693]|uniref:Uncharacterized protein n=1 Tax=Fusobacterium periodonticum ATCC 33693 TaxID=546275 RepID=D4CRL2_9FUSO|nr:hypothetical protein FUSPEROL_00020 [Fusobacterium periodonticum ATCC 33693]DAN75920.1 MAG TPA: hypothetical protein [Caudoviricetes sp.]
MKLVPIITLKLKFKKIINLHSIFLGYIHREKIKKSSKLN